MEDVLALYERPYDPREPVICWDEKPVALHADVRPPRPARPGHVAKRDNEYRRCGTANIFAIVEPHAGRHLNRVTPTRSGREFALAIASLIAAYPAARTIHLVLDNLNIHDEKSLVPVFGTRRAHQLYLVFIDDDCVPPPYWLDWLAAIPSVLSWITLRCAIPVNAAKAMPGLLLPKIRLSCTVDDEPDICSAA